MAVPAARQSLRSRLLALALLPLGVVLPLLLAILAGWGESYFDRFLTTKVRSDLVVSDEYYQRVAASIGSSVDGLAASAQLARLVGEAGAPPAATLSPWLAAARERLQLDFLHLLDARGCVLVSASGNVAGCFDQWPVVRSAREGRARIEADVFSSELLAAINPLLAAQARIALVPTLNAVPDSRAEETRGLVLHSASPVLDRDGNIVAVLAAGVLLNRNLAFVDRLNEIVYPDKSLPLGSVGTATLFLGDVRIATNVRLFKGERAIGTRVSSEVREQVLERGAHWLDRAFVVSDWYVSGYRPLTDSHGKRVGMLYVGFLQTPFTDAKRTGFLIVLGLFAGAMVAAGVFSVLWARRVFRPVERMHATMNAVERGDGNARVGEVDSVEEIVRLATHLDTLLERQQAQAQALQRWGQALDAEVSRRTAELNKALTDLKAAQNKLVMNEKLAAIGQLTAGLAHEINNPIAVIQGNLDVAREVLGARAEPVKPELRLIQEQVHRVRLIVAKLLQFAQPQEYVGYFENIAMPQLFQDCLLLVGHLLKKGNITIAQRIDSARQVVCNKNELQQVVINLVVNAIQVMPDGGTIRMAVEDWDQAGEPVGVKVVVTDNGPGISEADRKRLFQPFYTARKPGGHGLGLWVSKSLIERYGGDVTVQSEPGAGACFTVWLRNEPLTQSESRLL